TYNDGNGNTVGQTQKVIIKDDTAPTPDVANLQDIEGECGVIVADKPTATDNCKGVITATTEDPLMYNVQGDYSILWKYDDGNGNVITQTQAIKVHDTHAPV